jgi:CHASE3 domain sensor protein
MPSIQWEWKLTPQILVSFANLLVLSIGVVGVFYKLQADVSATQEAVKELRELTKTARESQTIISERLVKVETKMDFIIPILQNIKTKTDQR